MKNLQRPIVLISKWDQSALSMLDDGTYQGILAVHQLGPLHGHLARGSQTLDNLLLKKHTLRYSTLRYSAKTRYVTRQKVMEASMTKGACGIDPVRSDQTLLQMKEYQQSPDWPSRTCTAVKKNRYSLQQFKQSNTLHTYTKYEPGLLIRKKYYLKLCYV